MSRNLDSGASISDAPRMHESGEKRGVPNDAYTLRFQLVSTRAESRLQMPVICEPGIDADASCFVEV